MSTMIWRGRNRTYHKYDCKGERNEKKSVLLLVAAMVFSLAACGSQNDVSDSDSGNTAATQASQSTSSVNEDSQNGAMQVNPAELVFHPATSGSYATIKVDSSVKMDDESAWLDLCPAGKDYITELEADEVDVVYFYAESREEDSNPYVFACDFEAVEDGKYALIVATSDDENVGYVAIQLAMEKKGDSLTFDFENAQLKERPAK